MQKREKRPFFGLFEMQFTLFPILHFVNPLKSDTNTGTLVIHDNDAIEVNNKISNYSTNSAQESGYWTTAQSEVSESKTLLFAARNALVIELNNNYPKGDYPTGFDAWKAANVFHQIYWDDLTYHANEYGNNMPNFNSAQTAFINGRNLWGSTAVGFFSGLGSFLVGLIPQLRVGRLVVQTIIGGEIGFVISDFDNIYYATTTLYQNRNDQYSILINELQNGYSYMWVNIQGSFPYVSGDYINNFWEPFAVKNYSARAVLMQV